MNDLKGLTQEEVKRLLKEFGPNEIIEKRENIVLTFIKKFTGLTSYIIEITIIVSFILKNYFDAIFMLMLLIFNAVQSFRNEFKATKIVESLKEKIPIKVKVLRDGVWSEILSRDIVPEDIIKINIGDIVPADSEIIEGYILVDESMLTGESIPKEKGAKDKIFSGSSVVKGKAICKVLLTGNRTYFGKTIELIEKGRSKLIIEEITLSLTKYLLFIDSIFIFILLVHLILSKAPISQVLPTILTLLIASIPVALPSMMVFALSLGSIELSKNGVLIRKLDGIENSAMMDILCVDKTGTITENKIKISDLIILDNNYSEDDLLELAYLCSDKVTNDPIDSSIVEYSKEKVKNRYELIQYFPFDPEKKYSKAIVSLDGKKIEIFKGAPQILLNDVSNDKEKIEKLVQDFAKDGKRSLALSIKDDDRNKIIGLFTFFDFPRKDSKDFIEKIKNMGISIKMITGDNFYIAKSIAKIVGVGENVVNIRDLKDDMDIEKIDVYSEVLPEDKFNIVKIYQSKSHIVGMTGDGANDAPSLKKADLGIAVSNSLNIAKESSKIILTKPGLINIVDLIIIGRKIYKRIVLWIINKIVKTFQIVFFIVIASLIYKKPIITPTQMILILLLYDFVTMSIATDNVIPNKKPERWNLKKLISISISFGLIKIIELFFALYLGYKYLKLPYEQIQSFIFYILVVSGLFNILNFREERFFFSSKPSKTLILSIILDIFLSSIFVLFGIFLTKLSFFHLLVALLYSFLVTLFLTDIFKIFIYKSKLFRLN